MNRYSKWHICQTAALGPLASTKVSEDQTLPKEDISVDKLPLLEKKRKNIVFNNNNNNNNSITKESCL
jgi:hypothetical protein